MLVRCVAVEEIFRPRLLRLRDRAAADAGDGRRGTTTIYHEDTKARSGGATIFYHPDGLRDKLRRQRHEADEEEGATGYTGINSAKVATMLA
jgi:hypothetical protein